MDREMDDSKWSEEQMGGANCAARLLAHILVSILLLSLSSRAFRISDVIRICAHLRRPGFGIRSSPR